MLNEALNSAPADALILPMTGDLGPAAALATQLRQPVCGPSSTLSRRSSSRR